MNGLEFGILVIGAVGTALGVLWIIYVIHIQQ